MQKGVVSTTAKVGLVVDLSGINRDNLTMLRRLLFFLIIASVYGLVGTAAPAGEDTVYLFSFFTGGGEDGLRLAYSFDLYNWTEIPGPHLRPQIGDKIMRDPFLARAPDGVFHLVWTTGWRRRDIGYADSPDLLNWSEQKLIGVMAHKERARNCWAPKLFYDEDLNQWMILWSTWLDDGSFPPPAEPGTTKNNRIFYVTTKDFETFSQASLLFDPGYNCIDAYLLEDENEHLLFFKDERDNDASQFNGEHQNIRFGRGAGPYGPFGSISDTITGRGSGTWHNEGPSAIKVAEEYYVFYDHHGEPEPLYFGAVKSTNLVDWLDVSDQMSFPQDFKHGTILRIPHHTLRKLLGGTGGDLNGDGVINFLDFSILIEGWL